MAAVALGGCSGAAAPSKLRILNAMTATDGPARLRWCPVGRPAACAAMDLAVGHVSDVTTLMPGRYRFSLCSVDGRPIDTFVYGIGAGERNALLLFGFARGSPSGSDAEVGRWLGGSDHRVAAGLGQQHLMVDLTPIEGRPPKARLAALVPGLSPLTMTIGGKDGAPVPFGTVGDGVAQDRSGAAHADIRLTSGGPVLGRSPVSAHRNSVLAVLSVTDGKAATVLVE